MQELETIVNHEHQSFDHIHERSKKEESYEKVVALKNQPNRAEKLKKRMLSDPGTPLKFVAPLIKDGAQIENLDVKELERMS